MDTAKIRESIATARAMGVGMVKVDVRDLDAAADAIGERCYRASSLEDARALCDLLMLVGHHVFPVRRGETTTAAVEVAQ
jgi:hypothetical protein